MPAEYEYDDEPLAYLLLGVLATLIVLTSAPVVFRKITGAIHQRRQWSKRTALIIASNRRETYKADQLCTVCLSPARIRCSKCGAVPYCSTSCEREHWKQGHTAECPLMEEIDAMSKRLNPSSKIHDLVGPRKSEEYMDEESCAHCDSPPSPNLLFWSHLDVINSQGQEAFNRIRYVEDQGQETSSEDSEADEYSVSKESPPRHIALTSNGKGVPKHSCDDGRALSKVTCCSKCKVAFYCSKNCQRYETTYGHQMITQLITSLSNDENADNNSGLENGCRNHCIAILYCPEHCQRCEWKTGHEQDAYDEEITKEASKLGRHFISPTQTLSASAMDHDHGNRRRVNRIPAAIDHADHPVLRNRYPTSERSSSSHSSCGLSSSMDSSGSDAMSSLHG